MTVLTAWPANLSHNRYTTHTVMEGSTAEVPVVPLSSLLYEQATPTLPSTTTENTLSTIVT